MGAKLVKSKSLCCQLVVFTRYSLLSSKRVPIYATENGLKSEVAIASLFGQIQQPDIFY